MILIWEKYTRNDVRNNPWLTFVFGDNDLRLGSSGQAAACRDMPNTIGIRTKHRPSTQLDAYYSDKNYSANISKIDEDLRQVKELLDKGNIIVFPAKLFGTGRAMLRVKAPKTFTYLNNAVLALVYYYREQQLTQTTQVKAFDINVFTVVPRQPYPSTIEALEPLVKHHLREFSRSSALTSAGIRLLVKMIHKRILEDNPLGVIEDPLWSVGTRSNPESREDRLRVADDDFED